MISTHERLFIRDGIEQDVRNDGRDRMEQRFFKAEIDVNAGCGAVQARRAPMHAIELSRTQATRAYAQVLGLRARAHGVDGRNGGRQNRVGGSGT